MKLYVLAIASVVTLATMNSCKKELPSYCEKEFFGEILMTDNGGTATTVFGTASDVNLNILYINTGSDSVKLSYSAPWIVYEITGGGQLYYTTNSGNPATGVSGMTVPPGDTVSAPFSFNTFGLPVGSYQVSAENTYQYKGCEAGITGIEKSASFTVQ